MSWEANDKMMYYGSILRPVAEVLAEAQDLRNARCWDQYHLYLLYYAMDIEDKKEQEDFLCIIDSINVRLGNLPFKRIVTSSHNQPTFNIRVPQVLSPAQVRRTEEKPVADFLSYVTIPDKANELMAKLRELMKGKSSPQEQLMPLRAMAEVGVISRPPWRAFCEKFPEMGVKESSYNNYMNLQQKRYEGPDFEVTKRIFEAFKPE